MEEELYAQMRQLEDEYWWFVGKRFFIFNFIKNKPARALDLGCGTGIMMERLGNICDNVFGIDNSLLALSYVKKRINKNRLIACDSRRICAKDDTFDLIIASDLLEHIPDDDIVLEEANRVLKTGGKLIITVPAFNFLWSKHDESAQHLRRYNIDSLKRKIHKANFSVEKLSYTNFFAFPLAFLARRLRRFVPFYKETKTDFFHTPGILNKFFIYCYKLEAALLRRIDFPFGISILGVLVKS